MRSIARLLSILIVAGIVLAPCATAVAQQGNDGSGSNSAYLQTDLPGWAREVVVASIDAQTAWEQWRQTDQAVREAIKEAKQRAQASPEVRQARQRLAEAQQAYARARRDVTNRLANNPDYRNARDQRNAFDPKIEAARQRGDLQAVYDLAQQKLQQASRASRLEAEAMKNEQAVQQAWDRLVSASQRFKDTRQQATQITAEEQKRLDTLLTQARQAQETYAAAARRLAGAEAAYAQALADRDLLLNRFYGVYYLYGEPYWSVWSN